ncbi:MAG: hypothetical protein QW666_03975 [Candidatus Woesearchaeota archaeon]
MMEKKKISWLKKSLIMPATLLGALIFGCKTASALDEPSFLRQHSKPAAAAKTETQTETKKTDAEANEPGKYHPLKFYLSGKGAFAEDYARGSGSLKAVISPEQQIRIPIYLSGSYTESEQDDKEMITTKTMRGGAGLGKYLRLSDIIEGYGEASLIAEETGYEKKSDNLDINATKYFAVGKIGIIAKDLDLKLLLSGGYGKGEYAGTIGTADLEDIATRGFISLKGKMKILGKGNLADFDSEDEESSEEKDQKGQGVYALAGICYDEQNLRNLVKGRIPSAELGLEWRDEFKGMPVFIRVLGTARQEEYLYPYAKDKKDTYYGIGAEAGIKVGKCLLLTIGGGYDGEQHGYGTIGAQLSFGIKPKKK